MQRGLPSESLILLPASVPLWRPGESSISEVSFILLITKSLGFVYDFFMRPFVP
jgi:hypothetical protein